MIGPYKILRIISLVVTLYGAATMALSQSTVKLPNSIIERIQKAVTCRRIPGLSLSVVFNGQEVISTGFGLVDVQRNVTVDGNTRFLLGSVTKTFTATLLGMLLTDSKYRNGWDTLVADIMGPDFQLIDSREKRATFRDVLSHRMGLASYRLALMLGLSDSHSNREYCSRFRYINSTSFNSFRNQFEYNNQMFVLAGCMAEAIIGNGSSFETLLRERIFEPLEMNDTVLLTPDNFRRETKDLALMYYVNETDKKLHHLNAVTLKCIVTLGPAGGIISTAADMKKWMLFHLNQGKDERGRQLIQEDLMERMFTAHIPMNRPPINKDYFPALDLEHSYGLGFILGSYRGYPKIMHTGRLLAYETRMTIHRGARLGIYSACNGPSDLTTEIHQVVHYMITDALLNLTNWLNDSTICTFPKPWSLKLPRSKIRRVEISTVAKAEGSRKLVSPRDWIMSIKPDEIRSSDGMNENRYFKLWLEAHYDLYAGIYGHALLGNFTVTYNNSDDNLHFSFGLLGIGILVYDDVITWKMEFHGPMAFLQVSHGPYIGNRTVPVGFADRRPDRRGAFRSLIAYSFEQRKPPIFRRDLHWVKMSKAPLSILTITAKQRLLIIVACVANLMVVFL